MVYDQTLIVSTMTGFREWALLSSRIHEVWSNCFGGTLEDRPRYNIADCFETFPFPDLTPTLEEAGQAYYEFRAALMQRERVGLTTVYNWFHDPECECPDIPRTRDLHVAIDRAVLDAYGWSDVSTVRDPILEFGPQAVPRCFTSVKHRGFSVFKEKFVGHFR
jgi:hypothetical protein